MRPWWKLETLASSRVTAWGLSMAWGVATIVLGGGRCKCTHVQRLCTQEPARVVAEDGGEAPTQAEDQDHTSHTSTYSTPW